MSQLPSLGKQGTLLLGGESSPALSDSQEKSHYRFPLKITKMWLIIPSVPGLILNECVMLGG